jgi:hypothetical protein
VLGSERSIKDTWDLTISDTNLMFEVGLRVNSENYDSYLPSLEYQGSFVEGGDYKIKVNGDIAETFNNLESPDEREIIGIVNS